MVELRDVTKSYGDFQALKEASFQVRAGEFMTLLGPSGCGKTTCLRLISGFETPDTGRVFIDGKDVVADPPYRRDVNQVFQNYALFPHMSVRDNITFGLRMKRISSQEQKKRIDRVVQMSGLESLIDRKPSQLSGGQRQRVALARAIVCEPKVLLLDEPLSALDAKLRAQMRLELKQLQKKIGITFIFVTHDQEEALTMSDRVAVMNAGRVEQLGTVEEIYHHPTTRFVASFIGETNIVEAEVIGGEPNGMRCRLKGGLELSMATHSEISAKVLLSLRPEKIRIHQEAPHEPNAFPVAISMKIFKGAMDDLTLLVQGGLQLRALRANDGRCTGDFTPGMKAFASIRPEDIDIVAA
jgi:spermidine/putrescine transport system ATP-binding protein